MADSTPTGAAPAADPNAPELMLQNIYVKDASFEAPSGPNIQMQEWNPQFGLNMNTAGGMVGENMHEVVLTITLEAKIGERVAYLVEVKQAGVFLIRNYPLEETRRESHVVDVVIERATLVRRVNRSVGPRRSGGHHDGNLEGIGEVMHRSRAGNRVEDRCTEDLSAGSHHSASKSGITRAESRLEARQRDDLDAREASPIQVRA